MYLLKCNLIIEVFNWDHLIHTRKTWIWRRKKNN